MAPLFTALLCLSLVADGISGGPSYLYQPAFDLDRTVLVEPKVCYVPQPGDIILGTDYTRFWVWTHNLAGAFHPHHSGILFARPDGRMATLEAGPNDTLWCRVLEVVPHLKTYEGEGPVWIRRRLVPLTPEESAKLTAFCMAQDGKRFALIRQGGQMTWLLRSRGPLRTEFMGKVRGDHSAYFCSELVMEALVAGGLCDSETTRPGATFPRDIFFGRSLNPYLDKHLDLNAHWAPPARWVSADSQALAASRSLVETANSTIPAGAKPQAAK